MFWALAAASPWSIAGCVALVLAVRTAACVPGLRAALGLGRSQGSGRRRPAGQAAAALVVLGSGGHTSEMLSMLAALDRARYSPRTYVVAATDRHSAGKAEAAEEGAGDARVVATPRAREVGQSWVTTVVTTAWALVHALWLILVAIRPDVVLVNGPGTCVPFCIAATVGNVLGLTATRIVFVESMCRVDSLSLSGRILYPLAHRFLVQWASLVAHYPHAEYVGLM
ncbi:UDP-N-acetylglucosamine transferase subunit ALG14 [Thecamonas trahens ATCC 50062]|uniref:UDP-N-acetylglucosamine transferase subunit ALG14 n=1 Tax=Thecamonas trahens ATCC 50062 TaxID=461836 RepID=A0A0L0DCI0_THETB|nr:UDP-N-acetylglucosamine transferase subunit ALG14 [Thecamonas trahens ATCC 50062]KNC50042.1 UDP-N-acetylglucosamine transferase subunit ALG14 [Thecamonas trahens ATCC 50062]|eukprot:XP_013757208.1 UDP-N-acetylglucosamine transferase subunit ALG14 [Thecamonas trahens ATCC 50062]